ncbi:MAG: hypothetical protein JSV86_14410 [Gemmatimonadota bacterium]|nr:MAG: hypothetical protein JSV86_14410 [Gemmatimonadota bacterium]
MEANRPNSAEQAVQRMTSFIIDQIKTGADRETIRVRLMASGVREEVANEMVEQVFSQTTEIAEVEECTGGSLLPAIVGGGLAAVAGGLIWGLIAVTTGYEIGWIAWGVGLLAGWGVLMFARGRKGLPLQLVAVTSAALGIFIGKYFTFYSALKMYVAEEYGAEAVTQMSMLSPGVVQIFGESVGAMMSGFDALWIILAVGTAWGVPKAKLAESVVGDR